MLGAVVLGLTVTAPAATAETRGTPAAPANVVTAGDGGPSPEDAADTAKRLGRNVVRERTARIRPTALDPLCATGTPGRAARFPLFDDVVVTAVEEGRETINGHLVWHGTLQGTSPDSDHDVILTLKGGCDGTDGNEHLSADFMLGGDHYAIVPDGPGKVLVSQITPATEEHDGGLHAPKPRPTSATHRTTTPAGAKGGTKGKSKAPGCGTGPGDTVPVVDQLVAYTPLALKEAGGTAQIEAQIARGVALANDAFADSGAKVRARLVGTTALQIPASYDNASNASLAAFATPGDGIADTLPTLRTQVGADQVSTVVGGLAAGGVGYIPDPPGPGYANWAYSVVAEQAIWHYSFGHELGHNLGASHDRTTEPVQPTQPLGANGYFPASGDWSTVMSYQTSCEEATKGPCGRINRFSNAAQSYRGEPLGVPLNQAKPSDTVSVFNTTGPVVSAYNAPVTPDTLCSVAESVSPAGSGTVTAAQQGPYPTGMTSNFTATANSGHVFDHWVLDGKTVTGGSPQLTVTMNSDHTLQAVFREGTTPTHTVTTATKGHGTVKKASTRRAETEGTDLLYTAVPEPGHRFTGWQLDGSYAGNHDDIVLRVGRHDSTLTALFAPLDTPLTLTTRGGTGTVKTLRPGPYAEGETVTVTAVPAKGYVFQDWLLDGKPYGGHERPGKARTAVRMDAAHTLTAVFRKS
ncbi:M12 family metallo-peptidase [Streptomyces niveiscabiei]|uniref:InlB B-repeat-containing protein n=1 Tax=Streptomyces niveiscabiei TaxID=164115 RepID=UPI0029AA8EBB|nr:M12 family metallo-peptidase [Streptomyces niveiscabiei]MDX3386645.1 M12 family metallo-peptidase [Streptomyces niveiscabiei]